PRCCRFGARRAAPFAGGVDRGSSCRDPWLEFDDLAEPALPVELSQRRTHEAFPEPRGAVDEPEADHGLVPDLDLERAGARLYGRDPLQGPGAPFPVQAGEFECVRVEAELGGAAWAESFDAAEV